MPLDGPGVPLILKIIPEMETSANLRSELCTTFLFGIDYVQSYNSSKFAKQLSSYECILQVRFPISFNCSLLLVYYWYNSKIQRSSCFRCQPPGELWWDITFHSDRLWKKQAAQLRSQIRWSFHFCNNFKDQRHPRAVRGKGTSFLKKNSYLDRSQERNSWGCPHWESLPREKMNC